MDSAWKYKAALSDFKYSEPILDRRPSFLRDFELDRSAGLFLDYRCAVAQPAADAQIVDLQTDKIAAP